SSGSDAPWTSPRPTGSGFASRPQLPPPRGWLPGGRLPRRCARAAAAARPEVGRDPAEAAQIDQAAVGDLDAFLLEQLALDGGADRVVDLDAGPRGAALADHALPGQAVALPHGRAGDAGAPGKPGELRDLAVGRDPAARDAAHDLVD